MTFDADQLADRRRLKRKLGFWRIVAVLVALIAIGAALGTVAADKASKPHVAKLEVDGIIVDDPDRLEALREVADDDDAKALLVRIDSPGGTVVGGESLFLALRDVAAEKPVVAVLGEVAASGGYMGAIAADHIVSRSGTITGSIGVIMQTADLTGLLTKIGVKPEIIKSGPLKAQPNPMEAFSPEAREANESVVRDMFELFVDMVAERRPLSREEVLALADGRIFTGRQALDARLVDALGGEPEARTWLEENREIAESLPLVEVKIKREEDPWRELLDELLGKTLLSERLSLDGLVALWHPVSW